MTQQFRAQYQGVASDGTIASFRLPAGSDTLELYTSEHGSLTLDLNHRRGVRKPRRGGDGEYSRADLIEVSVNALRLNGVAGLRVEHMKESTRLWGTHHPRVWRGRYNPRNLLSHTCPVDPEVTYGDVYTRSAVAAGSLFSDFEETYRYVEPATSNLGTHSSRYRELLILACTEVETALKGILRANIPVAKQKESYSTKDYVKLCDPMLLRDWEVELDDYPGIPRSRPFATWEAAKPTTSLQWYDAYNGVKHDREQEFERANLRNVIDALAAVFILQCAQWGPENYAPVVGNRASPFRVTDGPKWSAGDLYVPNPADPHAWAAEYMLP